MAKHEDRGRRASDWRSSLSELDAWVLEEEEAVTRGARSRPAPQAKAQGAHAQQNESKVIDARQWPRAPETEARKADQTTHDNGEGGVVGLGRDGAPLRPAEGLFTAEEEAFIAQLSAWLRGRPNADVILEEVWHLAVGGDEEGFDDVEAPLADDEADDPGTELKDGGEPSRGSRPGSQESDRP